MDPDHLGRAFHASGHYENFPVASWLLPARMRPAMLALYQFARAGDDLADEGDLTASERLDGLQALERGLLGAESPTQQGGHLVGLHRIGARLREALLERSISVGQAQRLLQAFKMDAMHRPPTTEAALLDYCSRSANPVGRLVLAISGVTRDPEDDCETTRLSDAICSGLQLVNFAQDLGEDFSRRRIYTPMPWWPDGWTPDQGQENLNAGERHELARRMAQWGADSLQAGRPLINRIKASSAPSRWRLALEIALVIEGGEWIAKEVLWRPLDVWQASPRISKSQLPVILLRAIHTYLTSVRPT
ncbi:MAG: hypothetical protein FGM18_09460 [Burkholderiaceae bacterium]|nr:hypothetical protein [Burkholderiaceae bacterium]